MSDNEKYWQDRAVAAKLKQIEGAEDYADDLIAMYTQAIKDMDDELAKWYGRYAGATNLTIEQARQQLTRAELRRFHDDVDEYIRLGESLNYSDYWAEELERRSALYHITRFDALQTQLEQQLEMIYAFQKGTLDDFLMNQYKEGCYLTAFDIQDFEGVYSTFEKISDEAAKKVLATPWTTDGKLYSIHIWENQVKLINNVKNILTVGLTEGRSYDRMAQELTKRMETSAYNAGRLIHTEAAYFQQQAQYDTFNKLNVEKVEIIATLDNKTCSQCGKKDSTIDDLKNMVAGVTAPPFHVWCRCTTAPYFGEEFTQGEQRAYRDPKTGKTKIIDKMSYTEWKERFLKGGDGK